MAPLPILGYANLLRFFTQDASCRWTISRFCCPNTQCSEFGRRHAGNLSVHDRFGKHRQHRLLCCHVCQHTFSENKGTVFFRAKLPHETIVAILRHLQEGCGIRATARLVGSIATPSSAWPAWPAITPTTFMTSSWLFPPATREVQFDEKWAFVGKKQKNCDPNNPDDAQCGDYWDFVAFDPEHRLVLAVVPGGGRPRTLRRSSRRSSSGWAAPPQHS